LNLNYSRIVATFSEKPQQVWASQLSAHLLNNNASASEDRILEAAQAIAPKAKRVVYLFQNGAPTHLELFDHKPQLAKLHGEKVPESYMKGKTLFDHVRRRRQASITSACRTF
jgi:hypothetical protein